MKNLVHYQGNCFDVHRSAIAAKEDVLLRNSLLALNLTIQQCYQTYDDHFQANTLEQVAGNPVIAGQAESLLKLYEYKTKVIRDFRKALAESQERPVRYTCQSCGLEAIESLDHILPKTDFPEFVVNPYNLLPACSKCNGHKSFAWIENGRRLFLNLYTDQLPPSQYLFVNVFMNAGDIDFEFYLNNHNGVIDANLFSLITSHFSRLHLFERLRLKSIGQLTELENSIRSRLDNLDLPSILAEVTACAEKNKQSYGANYYKSIMEIELASSQLFQDLFR